MPIHDWTQTDDLAFHNLQLGWTVGLSGLLNRTLLPSSHFAMTERLLPPPRPGFLSLSEPTTRRKGEVTPGSSLTMDDEPPCVWGVVETRQPALASTAVTVRDGETHAVVSAILVVSQQEKRTELRLRRLVELVADAIVYGIHLVVVDLFPPSPTNPSGIHKALWDQVEVAGFEFPKAKPLMVASYRAGRQPTAFVEPVAVGETLPDIPLFLDEGLYVPLPLEETYQSAWNSLPGALKSDLEGE